ncbi:hypothetical protein BKA70DRAFT_1488367 [Coprinopsis sp. MPI-PUGE-AT-0042]|nr:hypothetical protein BKA70DRAFT_1488367 [Coprinopsis sp. MPI-PUGE-AT-0042]
MAFRCDGGVCFKHLWPCPPAIPLPPLRVFSNLRPITPALHGRLKPVSRADGRLGRDYANGQSTVVNANPGLRNRWPPIALLGHRRQHHRHHHRMVRRAAIPSLLDKPLNLRDFHVMGPGVRMDIWRDPISAEGQTEAYESDGGWECPVLPGRFLCVVMPSYPDFPSTRDQRQPQIDISRSLAYASHVLENAESPAVDLLFVKQFASELIATTFSFLESIYDGSAHVQPNLIRTFASPDVKLSALFLQ